MVNKLKHPHGLLVGGIFLALTFTVFIFMTSATFAADVTLTVNSTAVGDDANDTNPGDGICETITPGECTLRAAIAEANQHENTTSSSSHLIEFDIPGATLHTIEESSWVGYPVGRNITIDGYTQDGATQNTAPFPNPFNGMLRIELKQISVYGSGNIEVRGLIMNSTDNSVLSANTNGYSLTIKGSYLGTDADGLALEYAPDPIVPLINSGGTNGTLTIGGENPEDRNILAAYDSAIACYNPSIELNARNLVIKGNYIGVGADGVTSIASSAISPVSLGIGVSGCGDVIIGGSTAEEGNLVENMKGAGISASLNSSLTISSNRIVGNTTGIVIQNSQNVLIGGDSTDGRNLVSGNNGEGIAIQDSSNAAVRGNYIGVADDGTTPLANGATGISVSNSTDVTIGGTGAGDSNVIAHNGSNGVTIQGSGSIVSVLSNSIYSNDDLGIDLGGDGVTANDAEDPDTGPNVLLNFPSRKSVVENGGNTEVEFVADVPAGSYRIEFFSNTTADPSDNGEGETYLGSTNITSSGNGNEEFSYTLTGITGVSNLAMTATEIDGDSPSGFGSTSEFGAEYQPFSDLSLTKTIDNPEDYQPGGSVDYTVTLTNNGPDPQDLNELNDIFAGRVLFYDLLPPDQTVDETPLSPFNPNNTTDASCIWGGPGSAGSLLGSVDYPTYSVLVCAYSGGSSQLLSENESFPITFTAELANDSGLNYANYAYTGALGTNDSEFVEHGEANCDGMGTITCFIENPINNFAYAGAPTDVAVTQTFNGANPLIPGSTVSYTVTFTNNGSGDVNLANYPVGNTTTLLTGLYPAGSLTFTGTPTTDVICVDNGPGSNVYLAAAASDHPNYQLLACGYFGESQILAQGQSFQVVLNLTVNDTPAPAFNNYLFHVATVADPDSAALFGLITSATGDILDSVSGNNNFTRLVYSDTPLPDDNDADTGGTDSNDSLLDTGQASGLYIVVAVVLVGIAGVSLFGQKHGQSR